MLLNRSAGFGYGENFVDRLAEALRAGYGGPLEVDTKVVDDHPGARAATVAFLTSARRPSLVAAAGGGGTLRAVVEGVMDVFPKASPDPEVVQLAGLRMGSGNVVARRLGVAQDPLVGARQIGAELRKGSVVRSAVIRCTHGTPAGGTAVRHAVTMAGLGQWGRIPGDLTRWHQRHGNVRRRAAAFLGLERVTQLEYVGFASTRLIAATVSASRCELVEVDGTRRMRLLSAIALNFPLPPLPDPRITMSEEAVGLLVVPRLGRPFRRRLEPGADFAIRLLDRESVEFFLDEDPEHATGWLKLGSAGCIGFVPGRSN